MKKKNDLFSFLIVGSCFKLLDNSIHNYFRTFDYTDWKIMTFEMKKKGLIGSTHFDSTYSEILSLWKVWIL